MTDRYVVNDHGDCKSPKDRVVGPLPIGLFMASKWGVANHVLTGMILQVTPVTRLFSAIYRRSNSIVFFTGFGAHLVCWITCLIHI